MSLAAAREPPKVAQPWYLTPEHRLWAKTVIARAGGQCQRCSRTGVRLYADHIREIKDGGARLDLANGQALCPSCHTRKTNAERDRRQAR